MAGRIARRQRQRRRPRRRPGAGGVQTGATQTGGRRAWRQRDGGASRHGAGWHASPLAVVYESVLGGNHDMLLTFRSKAAADVLMLSEHAVPLLRAAGKTMESSPERGVFTVQQLPEAIAGIERAIREAAPPPEDEDDDERPRPHPVSEPV